ncbi:hypothetical protein ACJJTC_004236 [Scirpophaga incertulas]
MMFIIISITVISFLLYLLGTRNFSYWKRKGIKYVKPYPFVGSNVKQMFFQISFSDGFREIYNNYPNERFVRAFNANEPLLLVREPQDVQRILVTDFHCFYPRGMKLHKDDPDPLLKHLFMADGDLWKLLRTRMTPAFTTGKLKAMFPLIIERAEKLQNLAAEWTMRNDEVDVKDLMARYTTDFIGACGFGIDMDALSNENSVFRKLGNRIFSISKLDIFRLIVKVLAPSLCKNVPSVAPEITNVTTSLVKSIMEERNYEPSSKHDFIDLLLEVKKKGKMIGESIEQRNADGSPVIVEKELDDQLIAAQAFVFFAAGFETSSSTSSFTLHKLAFHPEEQKKCQYEIDKILANYDNKLCYDAINDMKYLKMCFNETMRLLPSLGILMRKSAAKYTFPDSDLTIDEGIGVLICNHAMQLDEKYFDKPNSFIPERFSPENIHKIPNHVFLPFGEGPRACIGERLGFMQALTGLAAILSQFTVSPSKNTKVNPEIDPRSGIVQTFKGGVPLHLEPRKKYSV